MTVPTHHQQALDRLVTLGVSLAEAIHDQAIGQAKSGEPIDPTLPAAFEGVTRTVRRAILLAHHVNRPARDQAPELDPTAARKDILRRVENEIVRCDYPVDAPRLHKELLDRLDAPDFLDDLRTRPVDAIVNDLRRDLGVANTPESPPWPRRTPQDAATLAARAAGERHPGHPAHLDRPKSMAHVTDRQLTEALQATRRR